MDSLFVALAHECTTAEDFEGKALAALEHEVGCDVAFVALKGLEQCPTVRALDRTLVEQAVAGGAVYERELEPVKRAALAGRGVAVDTDVLGVNGVERTRYFREVAALAGGRHSLLAYLSWRGRAVGMVMLGRTRGPFAPRDLRRMEALLPSLSLARAAFGLPCVAEPLPSPPKRGLLERWGWRSTALGAARGSEGGVLSVRDRGGFREMVAADGEDELIWTRAALDDGGRSGWPYVDLFHLAAGLAQQRRNALFIGCGGAVAIRQWARSYPGMAIDLVEREPAVVELARTWFELGSIPGLSVHVDDGMRFVERCARGRYDLIVVDAYDAHSLAEGLLETESSVALARALRPRGALAFNVIGTLDGRGPVAYVTRILREAFADVRVVPVLGPGGYAPEDARNVVLVAVKGAR